MVEKNSWEKKRQDSLEAIERSNKDWCREMDIVNPVIIIHHFKDRYRDNIDEGSIVVPPLIIEKLKQVSHPDKGIFYYHSLRIDQNSPDSKLLAYFPSYTYRQKERLISTTPGKYLQKFYAWVWDTEKEFADFVRDYIGSIVNPNNVHFAKSIGEIQKVYDTGPRSCMGNGGESPELKRLRTRNKIHPVAAYASGDLAVAYLKHPTNKNKITARCVVWPEKKVYSRVYGDTHRLLGGLRELGYKEGSFEGARLRKIKTKTGFLLPYMDNWYSLKDEDEKHFRVVGLMGNPNIEARLAGGFVKAFKCGKCGKYSRCELKYSVALNGAQRNFCKYCWSKLGLKRCNYCNVYGKPEDFFTVKMVPTSVYNVKTPYEFVDINRYAFRGVSVCKKCYNRNFKENTCASCKETFVRKEVVSKTYKGSKLCAKCFRSDRTKTLSKCGRRIVDVKKKSKVKCNCFVCHLESEKANANN